MSTPAPLTETEVAALPVTVELEDAVGREMYCGVRQIRIHRATVRYWPPADRDSTTWIVDGPVLDSSFLTVSRSLGESVTYSPPTCDQPLWLRALVEAHVPEAGAR